jgi:hypothetical protein
MPIIRLFFFITLTVLSSYQLKADDQYLKYCCSSENSLSRAKKDLEFLSTSKDRLKTVDRCLQILTTAKRVTLFQNIMLADHKDCSAQTVLGQQASTRRHCHLDIKTIGQRRQNTGRVKIDNKAKFEAGTDQAQQKTNAQLTLKFGSQGKLRADDFLIEVLCQKRGKNFELSFSLSSSHSDLSTTITIPAGLEREVSSTIQDLLNQESTLANRKGIQWQKYKAKLKQRILITARERVL